LGFFSTMKTIQIYRCHGELIVVGRRQMALQAGEREVSLSSRGRAYTIDFTAMQQIGDESGSPSKVLRQEYDSARASSAAGEYTSLGFLYIICTDICTLHRISPPQVLSGNCLAQAWRGC